jgi:fructose-bisphosphate aldolase class II
MPRAHIRELLQNAQQGGYAVPAFNVIGLEHAEAIVSAADHVGAPTILQISENAIAYHQGAVEPIGTACTALADRATAPIALHLDHATTEELCARAVACGFSSVMLDSPDADRVARLVAWAHERDVAVEAALGVVGGKNGVHSSTSGMTDPDEAALFAAATGVDALAIAIGTSHAMQSPNAKLDMSRLEQIRRQVTVPLVLHGASGVPDSALQAAVTAGIVKVNLATQLNVAFTKAVRAALAQSSSVDPRTYLAEGRQAVRALVEDRLQLLGTAGQA